MQKSMNCVSGTTPILKLLGLGLAILLSVSCCKECSAAELTPAQKAYFPQNAPLDPKLWQWLGVKHDTDTSHAVVSKTYRFHYVPRIQARKDLCEDYLTNVKLNGGPRVNMCALPNLNPKFRHAKYFSFFVWEYLRPQDHLDLIRRMFIQTDADPGDAASAGSAKRYWYKMGPLIERLLEQDKVQLTRTKVDIGTGHLQDLYGLILQPHSECSALGGKTSQDVTILYTDANDPASLEFNALQHPGSIFRYKDELIIGDGALLIGISVKASGHLDSGPECAFEPVEN